MKLPRQLALPLALGGLVFVTRLPFVTRLLWAWDSVLYARALEHGFHVDFDLDDQRPQPPGYILYVATASLARNVLSDSNAALVAVSVLASVAGVVALFLLARRFARTEVALFAAVAYAVNPLVWTYSEISFPYAVLALLALVCASLFWEARHRPVSWTVFASVAFGILAGFRQDILLLLGPLWLWMVVPRGWRTSAVSGAAAVAGCLVWFVPTAMLSDGLEPYLYALGYQTDTIGAAYSVGAQGFVAFSHNLRFTIYALAWGLLFVGIVLFGLLLAPLLHWLRTGVARRPARPSVAASFLLFWIVPGLSFYVVVHIGDWGYVLSVLPALYVLTAWLLEHLVGQLPAAVRPGWRAAAAAVALGPALLFLFSDARFSAHALAQNDLAVADRVAYVREHFAPKQTIILAREDFLIARYYLPEYRAWLYDPEPYANDAMKRKRAMNATNIVIFTEGLRPRQNLDVRYVELAPGVQLAYVPVESGDVLEFYGSRYMVREPP
ncbi:MAG TPA: glycosyltransferase family 39 protein [Candidatus Limnocylindria bacterium]